MTSSPIPSVFKEGWLRLNKKILFLSSADGVVSNFKQNKERDAGIIRRLRDLLPTTPAAARPLSPWLPSLAVRRHRAGDHHECPEAAVQLHGVLSHLDIKNSSIFPPMPGGGHLDEIGQRG